MALLTAGASPRAEADRVRALIQGAERDGSRKGARHEGARLAPCRCDSPLRDATHTLHDLAHADLGDPRPPFGRRMDVRHAIGLCTLLAVLRAPPVIAGADLMEIKLATVAGRRGERRPTARFRRLPASAPRNRRRPRPNCCKGHLHRRAKPRQPPRRPRCLRGSDDDSQAGGPRSLGFRGRYLLATAPAEAPAAADWPSDPARIGMALWASE